MRYSSDELNDLARKIYGGFEAQSVALRWCADNIQGIARREHLPDSRPSRTRKVQVAGHEFYVTVGFYPDDEKDEARIAEIFVKASKHGSDTSLFVDAWSVMASVALQYGVPWAKVRDKFMHSRGSTNDHESPSFLHAIVVAADKLLQEYHEEVQAVIESSRSEEHEQENPQSEDTGSAEVPPYLPFTPEVQRALQEQGDTKVPWELHSGHTPLQVCKFGEVSGDLIYHRFRVQLTMLDGEKSEPFYMDTPEPEKAFADVLLRYCDTVKSDRDKKRIAGWVWLDGEDSEPTKFIYQDGSIVRV